MRSKHLLETMFVHPRNVNSEPTALKSWRGSPVCSIVFCRILKPFCLPSSYIFSIHVQTLQALLSTCLLLSFFIFFCFLCHGCLNQDTFLQKLAIKEMGEFKFLFSTRLISNSLTVFSLFRYSKRNTVNRVFSKY